MTPNNHQSSQYGSNEREPLLGTRAEPASHNSISNKTRRIQEHFCMEIDRTGTDILLIFCYMITGLLDSSSVFIWGSFASMQTGNTVYLGLGLSGLDEGNRWIKSLISICGFCVGSLVFATFHRAFTTPRQRAALAMSFVLQMICISVAAGIVTVHRPSRDDDLTWKIAVPLLFVAFQSSGQAVASRVVEFNSLTSVVLTSIYCDLFSSPVLVSTHVVGDKEQYRRFAAVCGLLAGVLLGALLAKSDVGLPGALWTAAGCKGLIGVAFSFWRAKRADLEDRN